MQARPDRGAAIASATGRGSIQCGLSCACARGRGAQVCVSLAASRCAIASVCAFAACLYAASVANATLSAICLIVIARWRARARLKGGLGTAGQLLPSLLNPSKLKRVLEILWFSRQQKPVPGCPKAELLSIAVLERVQGRGVAQRLYQALTTHFDHAGEPAFCIVVGDALTPAHHFYTRMGAVPMAQISVHKGQGSTLYRHKLQAPNKEGIVG